MAPGRAREASPRSFDTVDVPMQPGQVEALQCQLRFYEDPLPFCNGQLVLHTA